MSNILKGIINEVSPHNYDSDWDYQDAVARSGKSRSSYRSQEDDTFDSDVAYSRKMYQLGQQQKAAKEKAQRDSDHDRLASGTNEDITEASNPYEPVMIQGYDKWLKLVSIPNVDRHAYKSDITAVTSLGDVIGEFNTDKDLGYVIKKYAKGVSESLDDPWGDQGNFAGDKPVNLGGVSIKNIQVGDTVKYFGQPSKVVAMSKDRKYSRITISKGMGTVTQDVLTRDLQQLGQGKAIEENDNIQTRMRMDDYYKLADAIQEKLRQAIKLGDNELVHKLSKERADLDARVKKYGLIPESQLDELSNEKLAQYKTAAALDAGKADKEGDYKRGDKRFSGIVKATKKQFANDTKKSGISQGINEFAPIKPPTAGAFGGNKDYGQPNSSRYIGGNKFVVGTTNNYVLTATIDKWGLEWDEDDEIWFLDSPGAAHIADASEGEIELPPPREQRNQIHDLVTDYLNERNSADLQKVAAYYGHSNDGEMATNESSEAPRFNSKQEVINHFVKNGKSAAAGAAAWERGYRGSSKKPIELKKPPQRSYHDELDDKRYSNTFENLGDQLKSNSLNALVQAKLAIEQQRQAEIEAWKRDFEKNTVQKAQQGLRREFEPTPVAQPGEKHSVLKARLAQLNNAIQKQELVDKLVDRLERKGLMTPAMQNDTDTRMHVKYGAKDNYQSLNKKLDNAIQMLQNRLNIRKISGLKEGHDERDEYDNPRMGRDYGKGNLFVDPGSNEFKKEVHIGSNDGERGRPKNLKGVSKVLPADAFGRTTGKIPDSARPTSKEDPFKDVDEDLDENLHKWFQEKWVRFGPDGKIRGDCARGDDSEGKPKCLPQSKAQNLGKAGRASAASRKRREDPNPERSGKAINVATKKKSNEGVAEDQLDELSCWSGYHRVAGTKAGFPGSCAKNKTNEEAVDEADMNRRGFLKGMGAAAVAGSALVNPIVAKAQDSTSARGITKSDLQKKFPNSLDIKATGTRPPSIITDLGLSSGKNLELEVKTTDLLGNASLGYIEFINDIMVGQFYITDKSNLPKISAFTKKPEIIEYFKNIATRILGTGKLGSVQGKISLDKVNTDQGVGAGVMKGLFEISYDTININVETSNGSINLLVGAYESGNYFVISLITAIKKQQNNLTLDEFNKKVVAEEQHSCPHCGGEMVSEELMNEKKDACYYKVKSRYKVWPSAYASGALVKCRKSGADSWGNSGKKNESIEEGWQDEAQELEDWSKEVNKKLYRAHETQRPGLARQLSKLEQKHFGSSLNQGSLTEIVKAALMALQKGQMVHYDPQQVGQMPFGNIVGDEAKLIAKYNITRDELAGYRMLHDKNMVDNLEQFLKLRRLVRAKSWPLEYYEELEKLTPEEAWLKMADDLNWSKDDMNEEIQSKTDDKLLAYYAQRKAEKQKQQSQPQDQLDEKWTKKYKDSINCSNPKGFSQKAHCAGKQKNESAIMKGLK